MHKAAHVRPGANDANPHLFEQQLHARDATAINRQHQGCDAPVAGGVDHLLHQAVLVAGCLLLPVLGALWVALVVLRWLRSTSEVRARFVCCCRLPPELLDLLGLGHELLQHLDVVAAGCIVCWAQVPEGAEAQQLRVGADQLGHGISITGLAGLDQLAAHAIQVRGALPHAAVFASLAGFCCTCRCRRDTTQQDG